MQSETLKSITEEILQLFKFDQNFKQAILMQNYHGFEKGKIPSDALRRIAEMYGADPRDLQAELVSVTQYLSHEIHMHKRSRAYCIVLGSERASAYLGRGWGG